MPRKARPVTARLRALGRDLQRLDIRGPFQDVDVQARADVPRDVAVERPDARVVHGELHDDVARLAAVAAGCGGQDLRVAALRVGRVGDAPVPGAGPGGEDEHVVAVQVHGVVGDGDVVVDEEADGGVGAEVVDVPFWVLWVGDVARVREEEDRVVVVCAEGDVVHIPEVDIGCVGG